MNWQTMAVTSGWEVKTAERINSSGFIAHCPVYVRKFRSRRRAPTYLVDATAPLFSGYIFIVPDPNFRREKFETTRVTLSRVRGGLISDEQMRVINSTALELTMIQSKTYAPVKIKRDELMMLVNGNWAGKMVKVRHDEKGGWVGIDFVDHPDWRPVKVPRERLVRAS